MSLKRALRHRSHCIQTDQPTLYKQPVRPAQIVHTIALNITSETYEIYTSMSVINRNPEHK